MKNADQSLVSAACIILNVLLLGRFRFLWWISDRLFAFVEFLYFSNGFFPSWDNRSLHKCFDLLCGLCLVALCTVRCGTNMSVSLLN